MSQLQHSANRGVGILTGRSSASNLNGVDTGLQQTSQPSPGATILDTLKKKMNQLKEELEISKDESDRSRQHLDEEKRRREVVRKSFFFPRSQFFSYLVLFLN
jgi:outer membrane murein-binding lipoprotein Lpp